MFEKFTDRARRVVVLSQENARKAGAPYIAVQDVVLGLYDENEGVAALVLRDLGFDVDALRKPPADEAFYGHLPFTMLSKKVMETSLREALQLGHNYIGTEHILLAIARVDPEQFESSSEVRRAVIEKLSTYRLTAEEEQVREQASEDLNKLKQILKPHVAPALRSDLASRLMEWKKA